MRVEELENRINQLPTNLVWQGHGVKLMVAKDSVLELVRQLEEPQKVVVPQFVAEWIEEQKEVYNIFGVLKGVDNAPDDVTRWCHRNSFAIFDKKLEIIARAFLDGYTIEQEQLYTVEIPNPHHDGITVLEKVGDDVIMSQMDDCLTDWRKGPEYQLTESEIRKDFEWAWQWAEEVKEVG